MENLEMYCLGLNDQDLEKISSLNYIPVGLGKANFRKGWLRDNSGLNISHKNCRITTKRQKSRSK